MCNTLIYWGNFYFKESMLSNEGKMLSNDAYEPLNRVNKDQ